MPQNLEPRRLTTLQAEREYREANPDCTCEFDDYSWKVHPQVDCPYHGQVMSITNSSDDPHRVGVHRKNAVKLKPNHFVKDHLTPVEAAKLLTESMAELEPDWKTPPEHYQGEGMQPWEVWEAFELDAWQAAAVKYILRAGKKGPAGPDYIKARNYIDYLINRETK